MHNIRARVNEWNAARYERKYSHTLQVKLLIEEWTEYHDAVEDVDKLDALCDVVYVALGGLWKLDSVSTEECALSHLLVLEAEEGRELDLAMQRFVASQSIKLDHWMVVHSAFLEAKRELGLTTDQVHRAMHIVCDANDSKSVKKTDYKVKANDGDKGPNFISPEPRLQEILNERYS